jgi:transposase-like protein
VLGSPGGSADAETVPPEFRRRALDLVESGRTVRDVAASLGIAESCLHRWRHRELDWPCWPQASTSWWPSCSRS